MRPKRLEVSAGGVVWKRSRRGPLLAFILDPYGKWAFAKGHVRRARGESLERAALREVEEEMGIARLRAGPRLGTTEIWFVDRFKHKGARVHKFITWFLMEAPPGIAGRPARHEGIKRIEWVSAERALKFSSYENVRPIIRVALRHIYAHQGNSGQRKR